jgi:hypothetical protein
MTMTPKTISICAIIAARNETLYLQRLLPLLAQQGIDVAIIDNESDADSRALYSVHSGNPVVAVKSVPYRGYCSLTDLLEAEREIGASLTHDWILHHDADEIMEHSQPGLTLRDAIEEADAQGYTALNFDEFVFLPEPGQDYSGRNYYAESLRYYFFEPSKHRLNRAWKRTANLSNFQSGGHRLQGKDLSIAPANHILRHYITLGQEHAWRKYLNRSFDPRDLKHGWHSNRLGFTNENLRLPLGNKTLFGLGRFDSRAFCKDTPVTKHFWEWENNS